MHTALALNQLKSVLLGRKIMHIYYSESRVYLTCDDGTVATLTLDSWHRVAFINYISPLPVTR